VDTYKVVFIDGVFSSHLSSTTLEKSFVFDVIDQTKMAKWLLTLLNHQLPNTAFAHEGAHQHPKVKWLTNLLKSCISYGMNQRLWYNLKTLIVCEIMSKLSNVTKT
jgi:hypothetical protein